MRLGRKTLLIALAALIVTIVFLASSFYSIHIISSPRKAVVVEIPKGTGLRQVAFKLGESGAIASSKLFMLYIILRGAQDDIKAGEYEFRPGDSMNQVAKKLISGDVIVRKITIPEGLTIEQIGELLDMNGVMSREDFIEKSSSIELTREILGESPSSFEGYLFPDTYSYTRGVTPEEFIRMMASRFKEIYKSVKAKSGESRLSDHQVVTLASIIEKETGNASERPLISAVFHNRLMMGMRLESDPTVIYGLGRSFDGNLTRGHLADKNSNYNTYTKVGLPPGPIANPGRYALESALKPAQVDYIYFVSKGDGTHQFSSNYREHREAVIKYQKENSTTGRKRR